MNKTIIVLIILFAIAGIFQSYSIVNQWRNCSGVMVRGMSWTGYVCIEK